MNQFTNFIKKNCFFIIFTLTTFFHSSIMKGQLIADFIGTPTSGCVPVIVLFDSNLSSGNPTGWTWDFGDGSSVSSLQFPQHVYNLPGQYSVTLTISDGTSTNTITKTNYIIVDGNPLIDFSQSDSGCVGKTFNFIATSNSTSIQNYSWNFGDGTGNVVDTNPNISHQFNTVGHFNVSLVVTTSLGCTSYLNKNDFITTGTSPISSFSATPLVICFGENVQFTSQTPAPVTGWEWYFGDGGMSNSANPIHMYNLDTSSIFDPFDVMLISFYNGCPDTSFQTDIITVNSPISYFSFSQDSLTPLTISFINESGGADSYLWNFGDSSLLSTDINPIHAYSASGTYFVTLTSMNAQTGCSNDTTITITIPIPTSIDPIYRSDQIIYPNPVVNNLKLKSNAASAKQSMKIRDLAGREIIKFNFYSEPIETQFDLTLLPKGIYFIEVYQGPVLIYNNRIIKQ